MVFWLWFDRKYVLNTPLAHYNSWFLYSLFTDLMLLCYEPVACRLTMV